MVAAKTAWQQDLTHILGSDSVHFNPEAIDHYQANVSALQRQVLGVVKPADTSQVQRLVNWANRESVSLYPISKGKNWGLGSKLPVKDSAIIVDLSRMNRIWDINPEFGYAVIEPGVTQQQLYDVLEAQGLPFLFNVTGSGKETSLLGNALDRGVGYLSTRAEDIMNLEVVLGNGDLIQTGFGHYRQAQAQHLYPYGIGPDLQGLFLQSNMGIVTRATFRLLPKQPLGAALTCGLKDPNEFEAFIDTLADLRRKDVIQSAFHIGNRERLRSTLVPQIQTNLASKHGISPSQARQLAEQGFAREMPHMWSAFGRIAGNPAMVKAVEAEVQNRMKRFGRVSLITDKKLARAKAWFSCLSQLKSFSIKLSFLEAFEAVYGLTQGIPTNMPLQALAWSQGLNPTEVQDLDQSSLGVLFVTPLIPLSGSAAQKVQKLTQEVFTEYGFSAFITLNMCNERSLEGVINVFFDRQNPQKVENAHQCVDQLTSNLIREGFLPYRVGIQAMDQIIYAKDTFWRSVAAIKDQLDPNHIIAPGRYNLY